MQSWLRAAAAAGCVLAAGAWSPAAAQSAPGGAGSALSSPLLDRIVGPAPPVAPALVARDAEGRMTFRAMRVDHPLRIDGALDESHYRDVAPLSDFVQVEPQAGAPATERTEVWFSFDDDYVYISARCWDTQMDRLVATEMRRDTTTMFQGNDILSWIFDPFYDRRNSLAFTINPLGGRSDGQITNERQYSSDWNPVWELKTGRFDGGWTMEAALPFKSLRYQAGREQVWGFNIMRVKRSKNEISALTRVPPGRGQQAVQQASYAATVVGLEAPPGGKTIDLKPYATSSVTSDLGAVPQRVNDGDADVGFDAKYAITQNLTADFTYNTDFAQVEADEQQVNLTRFSLFFPEKREFFLENSGTFAFGGVGGMNAGSGDAPILFYSRRIGLNAGRQVPLDVGGRLTGRAGRFTLGVLNIQAGDSAKSNTPATNFSVVRVKRDVLRKSSIGLIATNRSIGTTPGSSSNQAYGFDGAFGFFDYLFINTYWAQTRTERLASVDARRDDTSYRAQLDYAGDRYGVQLERIAIGDDFAPEVGFVRRDDMVRDYAQFRFSPRPAGRSRIRKYQYQAAVEHIANRDGVLESRERLAEVALEFQNADRVGVTYTNAFEFLPAPSRIGGVLWPVGRYAFDNVRLNYNMGQQRPQSANLSAEYGTFYSGRKLSLSAARGRLVLTHQLSLEPVYVVNRISTETETVTSHLAGSRVTFTMTPLMFVSALIQYNSAINAVSTNARLRWEYQPGSELFVVYNEERNTLARSFPGLSNRALIVKVNRLFRF
jgi:hypothetical protein